MTHKALIPTGYSLSVDNQSFLNNDLLERIPEYSTILIGLPRLENTLQLKSPDSLIESKLWNWVRLINLISGKMEKDTNLLIYCETEVTPYIYAYLNPNVKYQTWIEVKVNSPRRSSSKSLLTEHIGLFVTQANNKPLNHNRLRIAYEYCPACGKTTKDYGGRKHLYDAYGTLMSDVWKDTDVSWNDILPQVIIDRVKDMFTIFPEGKMLALKLIDFDISLPTPDPKFAFPEIPIAQTKSTEQVLLGIKAGDCLDLLSEVPSDSISLAFADPPYNLAKNYNSYSDDRDISDYLTWTDKWLAQYVRILKPGGVLVVINLPILCIRHFLLLEQFPELTRLNWVVWDALSAPRRFIMPANYSILVYSKSIDKTDVNFPRTDLLFEIDPENAILYPLADKYCLRANCIKARNNVTKPLTDLWTDIHRVKHNSKRLDHPCLLPAKLMERIITLFSKKGDTVLDTFNGVGTTTLTAHKLNRLYVGFDKDKEYSKVASERHKLINQGKDPFSVGSGEKGLKNNGSKRMKNIEYAVPKKTIQLAVKKLGIELHRIPTQEDVKEHLPGYWQYCQDYFANWSEVTRACLTTGMTENPPEIVDATEQKGQLTLGL